MTFQLGNIEHTMGLFELNDAYNFSPNQNAMVQFDRDAFWREITGQKEGSYEARAAKESRIQSPALK